MAGEAELLSREARAPSRLRRTLALVALAVLALGQVFAHHAAPRPRTVLVVTSVSLSGTATTRSLSVSGDRSRQLLRDLLSLQTGRISCGSPGPDSVAIRFATMAYDVNGECARVVREGSPTPLLESAALHDDLAEAIRH